MKSTSYFRTLLQIKNIPMLFITAAILFFSFPYWFWAPLIDVRGAGLWSSILLIALTTATLFTLLLLPLHFTMFTGKREEKPSKWQLILRFSLRIFIGVFGFYFLIMCIYALGRF